MSVSIVLMLVEATYGRRDHNLPAGNLLGRTEHVSPIAFFEMFQYLHAKDNVNAVGPKGKRPNVRPDQLVVTCLRLALTKVGFEDIHTH